MNGELYGYVRVSTKDQNTDRQTAALREFGVPENNVFLDYISGKSFERPEYTRLVNSLKPGDVLVVKSIDRLGRNYDEMQNQWRILTREKGIDIVILDMPLLDTRQERDLISTLISDIVLQLLSYVAQTEREYIHTRQAEGIAIAKAKGVRFGRKRKPIPPEFPAVKGKWEAGEISAREAGRRLNVSHATFMKWVRELKTMGNDEKSTLFKRE